MEDKLLEEYLEALEVLDLQAADSVLEQYNQLALT